MATEQELRIKTYTSEDAMLADYMTWAKNTYPQLRKGIFHVENEGVKTGLQGSIALAKGKLAGVPDVCSVYMGKMRWAEFKLPKGVFSDKQKVLFPIWEAWGIEIHVVRGWEDWTKFIDICLKNE